jgi:hypothetical protein
VGRDRLYHNQIAEAMFGRESVRIEPKFDFLGFRDEHRSIMGLKVRSKMPSLIVEPIATSRVVCSCGDTVELDQSMVGIKHKLGKMVECRKCRNARIAREKEEEDIAFNGIKEEEDCW